MDTVSVAPVPTLGGQWPEDWCGVAGPTSPSVPAVFSVGRTWTLTPFFKDSGIKKKKIILLFRPLSFGRRAVYRGCSLAGGILVPRPGIKPTAPAVEARTLKHWTTREVPSLIV